MLFKELENSKERILEWAVEQSEKSSTSVDEVLQGLIERILYFQYEQLKKSEVIEDLVSLMMNGSRLDHPEGLEALIGIRAWTRDNLVDWIWENAVDHESETWEDGLEEWAKHFFYD